MMTHEPVKQLVGGYDKHFLLTEYACRKKAYTLLQQDIIYTYYVGNFHIWHKHRNYLGYVTKSMVTLSPHLIKHMLATARDKISCFVIINADADYAFMHSKDVMKHIGPGILHKIKNVMSFDLTPTKIQNVHVPLNAFTTKDPFPDYGVYEFTEEQAKELV